MEELRKNIEKMAAEENKTEIEMCSMLQVGAANVGDDESIEAGEEPLANYRKGSDESRRAWVRYKKVYSGAGKPSAASFIAGWNAANNKGE